MKAGKVSESVLKRTVIKEIKYRNRAVIKGSSVGNDAVVFEAGRGHMVSSVASYGGELLLSARRAFAGAINSLAAKKAEPVAVTLSIMMPESVKESQLRMVIATINELGSALKVQLAGGHTETVAGLSLPVITVNAFGYLNIPYEEPDKRSVAGLDIVMAGETGLEGTAVLAIKRESELRERFTQGYVNKAKLAIDDIYVAQEAAVAVRHGAIAMHDTSKGGVFGALWEMGEYLKCGMNINLKSVPIRQETVELCEYFDMNPYFIPALGGLIIVTENGEQLVQKLRECGKKAEVIGCTVEGHDKAIINNEEKRFLEPPKAGKTEYNI